MTSEARPEKAISVSTLLIGTLTLRALSSHVRSLIALRPPNSEETSHMERTHVGTLLGISSI